MSDTTREALVQRLEQMLDQVGIIPSVRHFQARATADELVVEFLVVPRSDITIEYGVEFRSMTIGNHRSADVARVRARSMYGLGDDAARERETWAGPWQPIPLPENAPSVEQSKCPNPACRNGELPPPKELQGIAAMILCPDCNPLATPLPEDGDGNG